MNSQRTFSRIVQALEAHYGPPDPPTVTDPVGIILWEAAAYLADDSKRAAAFEALKERAGLNPECILAAPIGVLEEVCRIGGIMPELRARRLKEIAQIAVDAFDGDMESVLALPYKKAIRELKRFPSVGEPGAEKILLFTRTYPVLALESNGLRVLLRLGYGDESEDYGRSYRSVREALEPELPTDCDWLIRAHQLLRQHGRQLCRRNQPECQQCPIRDRCDWFRGSLGSGGNWE